jgi:ABC-2 type transport system ATP-binding protein
VDGDEAAAGIAIHARDLRVHRGGREVLHGLDLDVPAGRVTGLLGPSGCGKSTLMRAIVGVQESVTGTLELLGGRPAGAADLRARIGYVTQAPSVYADLTVRENLEFFARVVRAPAARIGEVLEVIDLADEAGRVVGSLSGGQRSRVSIATALLGEPDLLVLDEPTVGLDPVLRASLWDTFHALAAEQGTTLLVSSHVMDEADRCHGILLMRDGDLLGAMTPDELRERSGRERLEDAFLELVLRGSEGAS